MTEIYTFQGQQYNVHSSRLNEFMEKFPEATKQENVNVETVEPSAKDYAVDLFTSIPQSGLKALGGIVNYLEASERVVLDYVYKDLTPEEIGASFVTDVELPERDPINDNLITRKKRENKKLKDAVNFKEDKRLKRRNSAYILRRRAERVGLDPLAPGRQRKNVRDKWVRELKNREKLLNIK